MENKEEKTDEKKVTKLTIIPKLQKFYDDEKDPESDQFPVHSKLSPNSVSNLIDSSLNRITDTMEKWSIRHNEITKSIINMRISQQHALIFLFMLWVLNAMTLGSLIYVASKVRNL